MVTLKSYFSVNNGFLAVNAPDIRASEIGRSVRIPIAIGTVKSEEAATELVIKITQIILRKKKVTR